MKNTKNSGFTFVELLIAVGIFSVVAVSLYSALQTGILSFNKIDASISTYQNARIVFDCLAMDLRNSFCYFRDNSQFKGDDKLLSFFAVVESFERKGKTYPDVGRIMYELDGKVLKRTFYKGPEALSQNPEVPAEALSSEVKDISFEYAYPVSDGSKPYEWQSIWPKENDNQQNRTLPLAVRIKLSLTQKDKSTRAQEKTLEFDKTIFLPQREE